MLMTYLYYFLLLIMQTNKFEDYLSSKHPNTNFSMEKEKDGCLSFLDVSIFHENWKFATNVYQKKTFSGVYTTS